jgi:hypothetical protein
MVNVSITAESLTEAINQLIEQQEELEKIPHGYLDLELDKVIVIPIEPNTFS